MLLLPRADFDVFAGWKVLAKTQIDLTNIPSSEYRIHTGKDGNLYFIIDYELRVQYFSAHTQYKMFFRDQCYGSLTAEYV